MSSEPSLKEKWESLTPQEQEKVREAIHRFAEGLQDTAEMWAEQVRPFIEKIAFYYTQQIDILEEALMPIIEAISKLEEKGLIVICIQCHTIYPIDVYPDLIDPEERLCESCKANEVERRAERYGGN